MKRFSELPLQKRLDESSRILQRYTNRVPVIVDFKDDVHCLDKYKYLVPKSMILCKFISTVRNRIVDLHSSKAVFVFINDQLPMLNTTLVELYEQHKSNDNFLYIKMRCESAFGCTTNNAHYDFISTVV